MANSQNLEQISESQETDSSLLDKGDVRSFLARASYQGPLPPAQEFAAYEKALPGSADRILRMAETQIAHRHAYELESLRGYLVDKKLSMLLGFIFAVLILGFAIWCVILNQIWLAGVLVTTTMAVVLGAFLLRKRQEMQD